MLVFNAGAARSVLAGLDLHVFVSAATWWSHKVLQRLSVAVTYIKPVVPQTDDVPSSICSLHHFFILYHLKLIFELLLLSSFLPEYISSTS